MAKYLYWKVLSAEGLPLYDLNSGKFLDGTLKVTARVGSVGQYFKGIDGNIDSTGTSVKLSFKTQETKGDKVYNLWWVAEQNMSGWHLFRKENADDPTDYQEYLEYVIKDKIDNDLLAGGTSTVVDDNGAEVERFLYDYERAGTYITDVNAILNFPTDEYNESSYGSSFFKNQDVLGLFGVPYQFMPHVDPRLNYNLAGSSDYLVSTEAYKGLGKEYAEHIVEDLPLLFLAPGLPSFMTKYGEQDRETIIDRFSNTVVGIANMTGTDELKKNTGKYYTFEYATPEYYKYVNPACRIAAGYMGLGREEIKGVSFERVNWMEITMGTLNSIFGNLADVTSYTSIPFFIESETQITESFSNDTSESSIASTIDSFSSMGKEAAFILGYSQAAVGVTAIETSADQQQMFDDLSQMLSGLSSGNRWISNIMNNLTSVATGGRLIFPKIWNDSGFSRSYDVTIKLRSPDMDKKSLYLNIIVPFLHLLCMTIPRQIDGNPNGFFSPFLVRAIYKGFFNIDMGIITSMSVTKGDTAQWTPDGIPSSIDVNLTITDLYENISMTKTEATNLKYDTMDNTNMMDYIANLCGINIYTPEVGRTIRMWYVNNFLDRASSAVDIGLWGNLQNSIANSIMNVWNRKRL